MTAAVFRRRRRDARREPGAPASPASASLPLFLPRREIGRVVGVARPAVNAPPSGGPRAPRTAGPAETTGSRRPGGRARSASFSSFWVGSRSLPAYQCGLLLENLPNVRGRCPGGGCELTGRFPALRPCVRAGDDLPPASTRSGSPTPNRRWAARRLAAGRRFFSASPGTRRRLSCTSSFGLLECLQASRASASGPRRRAGRFPAWPSQRPSAVALVGASPLYEWLVAWSAADRRTRHCRELGVSRHQATLGLPRMTWPSRWFGSLRRRRPVEVGTASNAGGRGPLTSERTARPSDAVVRVASGRAPAAPFLHSPARPPVPLCGWRTAFESRRFPRVSREPVDAAGRSSTCRLLRGRAPVTALFSGKVAGRPSPPPGAALRYGPSPKGLRRDGSKGACHAAAARARFERPIAGARWSASFPP